MSTKAFLYILIVFAISILIRLPNLQKPLLRHHDLNSAVVLITLESWEQGGGAAKFNYVPLNNYQSQTDKPLPGGSNIDKFGNSVYISFPAGWYVLPYFVFKVFHIAPSAIALRILNLCLHFITLLLIFNLCVFIAKKQGWNTWRFPLYAVLFFVMQPALLWYFGNGYVCTDIMIPFAIIVLHIALKMLYDPELISLKNSALLIVSGILLIYMDWFGVFLLFVISMAAFAGLYKTQKNFLIIFACIIAVSVGLFIVLGQYISFLGVEATENILKGRYTDRSIKGNIFNGFLPLIKSIATSYLPSVLFLLIFMCVFIIKYKRKFIFNKERFGFSLHRWLWLIWPVACLLYNLAFWNWTCEHEFSLIPWGVFIAMFCASVLSRHLYKWNKSVLTIVFLASLAIYYFINRPGNTTMRGEPVTLYKNIGEEIKKNTNPTQRVFANSNGQMVIDYYAKRSITNANSYEEVMELVNKYKIPSAAWFELGDGGIKEYKNISYDLIKEKYLQP